MLVCPTSGATSHKTRFCVKLAAGDGNLVKKCWVRVPAVQPILESQLADHCGVLPEDKLQLIYGRLSEYMGILSDDEPGDEPRRRHVRWT